jgi:hypothetical protein
MGQASSDRVRAIYEKYAREWDAERNGLGWNDKGLARSFREPADRWVERARLRMRLGRSRRAQPCSASTPSNGRRYVADNDLTLSPAHAGRAVAGADMRTVSLAKKFDGILGWDSYFFLEPEDQRRMFEYLPRMRARLAC